MASISSNSASYSYPIPPPSSEQHAANANKTILLTGVNGYIASHIALLLLQRGYTVLGTSRSPATPSRMLSQPAFAPHATSNRFQHVVVSDITAPGAFDTAVKGVRGIIHTASPVTFSLNSVDAFFEPAIGGVRSILQSAYDENAKREGQIASFIQLSSIAAIVDKWKHPSLADGGTENRAFSEQDWNTSGEAVARGSEAAQRDGTGKFLPMVAYGASKAASENFMWDFISTHTESDGDGGGGSGKWLGPACTAICPGVTMGPPVNWPESPDKLNETLVAVWDIYSGKSKTLGVLPPQIGGATYIDVRDVAALHVWALEHPDQAGGKRYLATNGKAPPQAFADCLRELVCLHDNVVRERIIVGEPGKGYVRGTFGWPGDEPTAKATRAYDALGVDRFRGLEEVLRDTVEGFRQTWGDV